LSTNPDAAHEQPFVRKVEAFTFLAENLVFAYPTIVEAQLVGSIGALTHAQWSQCDIESLRATIDQERSDPFPRTSFGFIDTGHRKNDAGSDLARRLHMIANGEASVEDIDFAIVNGPGPRWAFIKR